MSLNAPLPYPLACGAEEETSSHGAFFLCGYCGRVSVWAVVCGGVELAGAKTRELRELPALSKPPQTATNTDFHQPTDHTSPPFPTHLPIAASHGLVRFWASNRP